MPCWSPAQAACWVHTCCVKAQLEEESRDPRSTASREGLEAEGTPFPVPGELEADPCPPPLLRRTCLGVAAQGTGFESEEYCVQIVKVVGRSPWAHMWPSCGRQAFRDVPVGPNCLLCFWEVARGMG